MAILWQEVDLPGPVPVGVPGPLPLFLVGLADYTLADLSAPLPEGLGPVLAAVFGLVNKGYLPVFVPDVAPPIQVTNAQLRLALEASPPLDADFAAAVVALGGEYPTRWVYSNVFRRNEAFIAAVGVEAAISPATLDTVFMAAELIDAQ